MANIQLSYRDLPITHAALATKLSARLSVSVPRLQEILRLVTVLALVLKVAHARTTTVTVKPVPTTLSSTATA